MDKKEKNVLLQGALGAGLCVLWHLSQKTHGQKALDLSFKEAKETGFNTPIATEKRAKYLYPGVDPKGNHLKITKGPHCAGFAAWTGSQTGKIPHGYHLASKDLMWSAKNKGTWHDVEEVRSKRWFPNPGDVAIYDQGEPYRGHTDRVISVNKQAMTYDNIGANETAGGGFKIDRSIPFSKENLLGFIEYDQSISPLPVYALGGVAIITAIRYWMA